MTRALVHVTAIDSNNTTTNRADMSTDLPADDLGSIVAETINTMWKWGCDPYRDRLVVVLRFEKLDDE